MTAPVPSTEVSPNVHWPKFVLLILCDLMAMGPRRKSRTSLYPLDLRRLPMWGMGNDEDGCHNNQASVYPGNVVLEIYGLGAA